MAVHVSLVAGHASANPKPRPGNLTHLSRPALLRGGKVSHSFVIAGGEGEETPGTRVPGESGVT